MQVNKTGGGQETDPRKKCLTKISQNLTQKDKQNVLQLNLAEAKKTEKVRAVRPQLRVKEPKKKARIHFHIFLLFMKDERIMNA